MKNSDLRPLTSFHRCKPLAATILGSLLLASGPATAKTTELKPGDDIAAAVNAAAPGDEIVLAGGTYLQQSKLTLNATGSKASPIVLRSATGQTATVERNDAKQNTINIENARHLQLIGLEVRGGSHGIRMRNASFITVKDCEIHDTADVALSANYGDSSYEGLHIVGNHIHDTGGTGEGMYLGCNSNACQVFNSLIEYNWVHHTNAGDVSQGDGIELKEGSYNNRIEHNVIHDTNYPCILTYSTVGNGGPNTIAGNLMYNCGDHAMQVAADAVIENNIVLGANIDGIRSQPHQSGAPSNLIIRHNTVIAKNNNAIRVSGASGSVVIANNALYAQSGFALRIGGDLSKVSTTGNVGTGNTEGVNSGFDSSGDITTDFISASFQNTIANNVFPTPSSALNNSGDPMETAEVDFNLSQREGQADVGAYAFDASGNPGWTLVAGFKETLNQGGNAGQGGMGQGGNAGQGGSLSSTGSGAAGGNTSGDTGTGGQTSGAPEGSSTSGASCQLGRAGHSNNRGASWLPLGAWLALALIGRRREHRSATVSLGAQLES